MCLSDTVTEIAAYKLAQLNCCWGILFKASYHYNSASNRDFFCHRTCVGGIQEGRNNIVYISDIHYQLSSVLQEQKG